MYYYNLIIAVFQDPLLAREDDEESSVQGHVERIQLNKKRDPRGEGTGWKVGIGSGGWGIVVNEPNELIKRKDLVQAQDWFRVNAGVKIRFEDGF